MKRLLVLSILLFAIAVHAQTKNYYVALDGNDTAAGTLTAPWKTLTTSVAKLKPDDVLNVRAGVWHQPIDDRKAAVPSGTAGHPVTVQAYAGDAVTLTVNYTECAILLDSASFTVWRGFTLTTGDGVTWSKPGDGSYGICAGSPFATAGHDNRFENMEIIGSGNKTVRGTGVIVMGNANQFINLRIHDFSSTAMYIIGNGNLIDGCDVYTNGIDGGAINGQAGPGNGVQVYNSGTDPQNNVVQNSKFHGNFGVGITLHGTGSKALNNLVYANGQNGIETYQFPGVQIVGNTTYANAWYGVAAKSGDSILIRNNILYRNALGDKVTVDTATAVTKDHNLEGTDPKFANAAAGDFHVVSGSPAAIKGLALLGTLADMEGKARPDPPTIGAFEVAVVVAPPPQPPQSILLIGTTALADGVTGTPYTQTLAAAGGSPPYSWSIVSGPIPAGLSFSAAGSITGTPTTPGVSNLTLRVLDGAARSASKSLTLTITGVAPPVVPVNPNQAIIDELSRMADRLKVLTNSIK